MTAVRMAGQHDSLRVAVAVLIAMLVAYAVLALARPITAVVAAVEQANGEIAARHGGTGLGRTMHRLGLEPDYRPTR